MQASDSSSSLPLSLLTPIGYQSGDCGYCKAEDSGASYYARTKTLSPEHYQQLMDRGWRRSGGMLYLPDASRSCCPHYTIRLPAANFKPSRDQRQTLYRWNRYVLGEKYEKQLNIKYPKTKEQKKRTKVEFDLLASVHRPEASMLKPGIEADHRLEVTLEPDTFTEEKFALFANYQRHVHHEDDSDISRGGFKRFLCGSPLTHKTDADGKKLGSYHQCYRLDGRLIAIGVLDLLPHAVSGVYFVYHSDFEKWSFGKISALREAALALEAGYAFYYMGYYIHSCTKMRYKGDYKPQYVLDFHNLEWHPLNDELKALMEKQRFASISKERERQALLEQSNDGLDLVADTQEIKFPTPLEAMSSELSLLELGAPGVLSLEQLQSDVKLDEMKVFARGGIFETKDIMSWDQGSVLDSKSLKGAFAELAATIGPSLASEVIVDFT